MQCINSSVRQNFSLVQSEDLIRSQNPMIHQACSFAALQHSILVVEDQAGYLELICEAIAELFPKLVLQTAGNGEEAWKLLNQTFHRVDLCGIIPEKLPRIFPSLIITDLNLPKLSGLELLTRIKQDKALQAIPVIVFSTSKSEEDILRCYQSQVNCFVTKPGNVEDFFGVVQDIVTFWLNLATLPSLTAR